MLFGRISLRPFRFAVRLPGFVMRQDVFLRLAVQNVNIVVCQIDNPGPQAARINHHRGG